MKQVARGADERRGTQRKQHQHATYRQQNNTKTSPGTHASTAFGQYSAVQQPADANSGPTNGVIARAAVWISSSIPSPAPASAT